METLAGVEKKLLKPAMIACLQLKRLQLGKEMTPGVKTYFVL